MPLFLGIILLVAAVFLIVAILLQSGKDKSLSGAITGGSSDTYYGQNKKSTSDRILGKVTAIVAVIFAALVLVSFIIQPSADKADEVSENDTKAEDTVPVSDESESETADKESDETEAAEGEESQQETEGESKIESESVADETEAESVANETEAE